MNEDEALRHKRLLREQLFLLKQNSGTAIADFLQHKLSKTLERQLKALVDGPLRLTFAKLEKVCKDRERQMQERVYGLKESFNQKITDDVRRVHDELQAHDELIERAERMMEQTNMDVLDSVASFKLLDDLNEAVARDNQAGQQLINKFLNLSRWNVLHADGVVRSLNRLTLDEPDLDAASAYMVKRPSVKLDLRRVSYESSFHVSVDHVLAVWPTSDKGTLDAGEALKSLLGDLVHDLTTNFSRLEAYAHALFSKYNDIDGESGGADAGGMEPVSEKERQRYMSQAIDSMLMEFEHVLEAPDARSIYRNFRDRLCTHRAIKVNRSTFASAWAMWVEHCLHHAVQRVADEWEKGSGGGLFRFENTDQDNVYLVPDEADYY